MTFLKIGGIEMPNPIPGGYSVTQADLDSSNSNRTETGVLKRERIRAGMYKIGCKWRVNSKDMATILSAISAETFTVEFYFGALVTAEMYAGDKSLDLLMYKSGGDLWDVSCNLIEK